MFPEFQKSQSIEAVEFEDSREEILNYFCAILSDLFLATLDGFLKTKVLCLLAQFTPLLLVGGMRVGKF